ncbi:MULTISPECIES: hypothetical protein [Stappiaceae]|uniref:hypothetical protein n=1 Tax=Stappiaceae TaxID=2821832 RepID=UPI00048B3CEE|nr:MULTISPECIES: hypothetical protein [Stappiaceae]MBG6211771.1 hypothetical protein [Labrenzia sp. EL_126]
MAFDADGFYTISHIGTVDPATPGTMRNFHGYVTNDDAAAVETGNYFLSIYDRLKVGDQVHCSLDMDGTPAGKSYVVSASSSTTVSITAFS